MGMGMGMGAGGAGGRGGGVIDGMVVRRWMEGGRWRWWEGGVGVGECVGEGMGVGGLRGLV